MEPVRVVAKIIQTATLDVLVSDFDKARADLIKLIEDYKGYVAKSEFNGNIGKKRSGTWTIRVPAEWFHSFVGEIVGCSAPGAAHLVDQADGDVKIAVLLGFGLGPVEAAKILGEHNGNLRMAIGEVAHDRG